MSAPVDVLAILAEQIDGSRNSLPHLPEILHPKVEQAIAEVESVRAAVAELIEALAPVENLDVLRDSGVIGDDELVCLHGSTVNRIRAALARVKGGAA